MEKMKGNVKKAAARRRIMGPSPDSKILQPPRAGREKVWALIGVIALVLALVSFATGVRLGKALNEGFLSRSPVKTPKSASSQHEVKKGDLHPSKEPKTLVFPPPEKSKEIDWPSSKTKAKPGVEKEPASVEEKTVPTSEGAKGSPPDAKFSLQIGAYNNPQEAQDLVKQLQKKGYPAYRITGSAAAKGTWHRVRVGHFQTLQEAREFALAFEKKEKIKTIITSLQ